MGSKGKLYFDTSAVNTIYDMRVPEEIVSKHYDVYVSYTVFVGLLCCQERDRSSSLASYLWKMTCPDFLLLWYPSLMFNEVRKALGLEKNDPYLLIDSPEKSEWLRQWNLVRSGRSREQDHLALNEYCRKITKESKAKRVAAYEYLLQRRESGDPLEHWPEEIEQGHRKHRIQQHIYNEMANYCKDEPCRYPSSLLPEQKLVEKIQYDLIPCTACGMEYEGAVFYCNLYQIFGPHTGDAVDMLHAFHAGFVDVFVTNDNNMFEILDKMVLSKKSKVVHAKDFVDSLRNQ